MAQFVAEQWVFLPLSPRRCDRQLVNVCQGKTWCWPENKAVEPGHLHCFNSNRQNFYSYYYYYHNHHRLHYNTFLPCFANTYNDNNRTASWVEKIGEAESCDFPANSCKFPQRRLWVLQLLILLLNFTRKGVLARNRSKFWQNKQFFCQFLPL